jgi:uncharacterized protein YwgA
MTIDIPSLVVAAGRQVPGRVRLQKLVYLLDQIGLESGFTFEYHHYGPYSEALAEQVEDDQIFGKLQVEPRRRVTDGVPYVVFHASQPGDGERLETRPSADRIIKALPKLMKASATVLELAATMHWLSAVEGRADWREELGRRKGVKTEGGRDQKALDLLHSLGLPPAVMTR